MKNIKRILGILLALAMMMVPLSTALAAPQTVDIDGEGEVIVSQVIDVDKTVTTLPTNQPFNFVLDPLGIYGMTVEEVEKLAVNSDGRLGTMVPGANDGDPDVWTALTSAGQIVFKEGYAPFVVNESNYAAAVQIAYTFTVNRAAIPHVCDGDGSCTGDPDTCTVPDTPSAPIANTVFPVTDSGTVNDEGTPADGSTPAVPPAPRVFIAATFSTANVNATTASPPESFSGTRALAITSSARTPLFVFPTATYANRVQAVAGADGKVESATIYMRDVLQAGTGKGTQFMLTGRCNLNADWNKLGEDGDLILGKEVNVGLTIAYTIDKASADQIGAAAVTNAEGLKVTAALAADDYTTVTVNEQFAPTFTADEQDAMDATAAANTARGDAAEALGDLQDAMAAFLLDDDAAALEAAIETAEEAQADAEDALEDVDAAISAAMAADLADDSPDIYLALELAKSNLETAILALETKIDEAKEALVPPADYTLDLGTGSANRTEIPRTNLPITIYLVGKPAEVTSVMNMTAGAPGTVFAAERYSYNSATGVFTLIGPVPGTANSILRIHTPLGAYEIILP